MATSSLDASPVGVGVSLLLVDVVAGGADP